MKLEQSFEVAAPLERVWEALIDVERVAPCLPGASVTGRNEDGSYNGEFKVKIGPTSAAYSGKLNMEQVDAATHTATMNAAGTDKRGQGGAKATIVSGVEAAGDQTKVSVSTDYHITGRLARFGRGGMIEEISNRLLSEFAANLQAMVAGAEDTADAPATDEPAPAEAAASAQTAVVETPPADADTPADAEAPSDPEPATDPEPASDAEPASDPDAALEGATPVAGALAEEPATPDPAPAASATSTPRPSSTPPPVNEPLDAGSLVGSVALSRVKDNPAPFIALVVGFLVALRVLRRR